MFGYTQIDVPGGGYLVPDTFLEEIGGIDRFLQLANQESEAVEALRTSLRARVDKLMKETPIPKRPRYSNRRLRRESKRRRVKTLWPWARMDWLGKQHNERLIRYITNQMHDDGPPLS